MSEMFELIARAKHLLNKIEKVYNENVNSFVCVYNIRKERKGEYSDLIYEGRDFDEVMKEFTPTEMLQLTRNITEVPEYFIFGKEGVEPWTKDKVTAKELFEMAMDFAEYGV